MSCFYCFFFRGLFHAFLCFFALVKSKSRAAFKKQEKLKKAAKSAKKRKKYLLALLMQDVT
jgi:hypothetical protein